MSWFGWLLCAGCCIVLCESQEVNNRIYLDDRLYAMHGVKMPDWADVQLHNKVTLELLLAVDASTSRHFGHDELKVRRAMLSLMHRVNQYAFQLGVHIIVVDVVTVRGYNLTLEQFRQWKLDAESLPPHDAAMLIRDHYDGGVAYVGGVCSRHNAIGISGFSAESPFEFAAVFFHELSHLLGLTHDATAHCSCPPNGECLKIDGFEKPCSAQALANLIPSLHCLQHRNDISFLPNHLPICGNGIVETGEECDCGPKWLCDNPLCYPSTCELVLPRRYLTNIFAALLALSILTLLVVSRRAFSRRRRPIKNREPLPTLLPTKIDDCPSPNVLEAPALIDFTAMPPQKTRAQRTNSTNTLDEPIPLAVPLVDAGYVKMYPPPANFPTLSKIPKPVRKPTETTNKVESIAIHEKLGEQRKEAQLHFHLKKLPLLPSEDLVAHCATTPGNSQLISPPKEQAPPLPATPPVVRMYDIPPDANKNANP